MYPKTKKEQEFLFPWFPRKAILSFSDPHFSSSRSWRTVTNYYRRSWRNKPVPVARNRRDYLPTDRHKPHLATEKRMNNRGAGKVASFSRRAGCQRNCVSCRGLTATEFSHSGLSLRLSLDMRDRRTKRQPVRPVTFNRERGSPFEALQRPATRSRVF